MAGKVLVNLATGMEDPERVTVAFLVATAALDQGKTVVIWTTKDAVRLALPVRRRAKLATAARRSSGCSSSSPTAAASSGSARSASTPAGSRTRRRSAT